MFRKPKRKAKASLRRKEEEEHASNRSDASPRRRGGALADNKDDEDEDDETQELLSEARKRSKMTSAGGASIQSSSNKPSSQGSTAATSSSSSLMQTYKSSSAASVSKNADLATRTAEHHPENKQKQQQVDNNIKNKAERGADGIFRDATRNKFLAGPIRAAQHVRVTARFDYQPDICKDYKDTGFCGFGDTCIYLHDRGDTMTGWQLEQQWEEEQKQKKAKQEQELQDFVDQEQGNTTTKAVTITTEDGLPFACHLCREYFKEPVVTNCNHYFCEACILNHVKTVSESCPICGKDTFGVFNQPTKLIAKKRRALGAAAAKAEDSWEQFALAQAQNDGDS